MANNRVQNGLVSGFSKKSKQEKIEWIAQTCFANPEQAKNIIETYWHSDEKLQRLHDEFIENAREFREVFLNNGTAFMDRSAQLIDGQ